MLQLKILHAATKKKERKKKIPTATIKTLHSHLNKYFFFLKEDYNYLNTEPSAPVHLGLVSHSTCSHSVFNFF